MKRRFAVALFATLAAGGLAHAQPEAIPAPRREAGPAAPAAAPDAAAPAAAVGVPAGAPGEDCGCRTSCCEWESHVCGPRGRVWAEADYLLWWMKGAPLPPLVTTSPAGTAVNVAGALTTRGTTVLFGREHVNEDMRNGFRVTVGGWIDCEQTLGLEANFFALENLSTNFDRSSTGTPILARPFFNANTNAADARLVAFPGLLTGRVSVTDATSGLTGTGVLARENLCCGCNYRVDVVGGYRYLQFEDRLGIREDLVNQVPLVNAPVAGSAIAVQDRFDATSQFHGFDFGLTGEYRTGPWRVRWLTKLAVGYDFENNNINGATTLTPPGGAATRVGGGLLALRTNIGNFTHEDSTFIGEVGLDVGAQLTRNIRAWVGYSGLYWNDAVWAGKQIDQSINPNLIPPNNATTNLRPRTQIGGSSVWAQGLDVGVEVRY